MFSKQKQTSKNEFNWKKSNFENLLNDHYILLMKWNVFKFTIIHMKCVPTTIIQCSINEYYKEYRMSSNM